MCAVSMVYIYGRDNISYEEWTLDKWNHYQELIRKAEEFDRAAKQPDCEDEEKKKWMKAIEERLNRLENPISDW